MRWMNNQVRFGVAAAVLCGGAAWGAHLYQDQPDADRTQTQQIRQLAERIRLQESSAPIVLAPTSPSGIRAIVVKPSEDPKVKVRSHTPSAAVAAKPPAPATPAPAAPAAPVDPVKNIALMGVTQQGNDGRAWLVDLESHTREVVGEGEEAFGFTVKEIDDESVLLARGTETFNLRLGEKSIPVVAESSDSPEDGESASGSGFGTGDGRGNRDDRRARFAAMMANMGGGRSSGRSWGGSSGGWGGRSSSGGGSWGNGGGGSSRWSSNSGGRSFGGGGFSGGGFGGGNWGGGGNFGGRNNQNSNLNRPTSNPQEARRRKSRLVGGADAIDEPAAFNNPQTLRRLGSASGQAFGTGNNGNNRNNQNRR